MIRKDIEEQNIAGETRPVSIIHVRYHSPPCDEEVVKTQAASWLIRNITSNDLAEDWLPFNEWLLEDPRNYEAYKDVESAWRVSETLKEWPAAEIAGQQTTSGTGLLHADAGQQGSRWSCGRPVVWIGIGIFLAIVCCFGFRVYRGSACTDCRSVLETRYGEVRRIPLPDGSSVTLDTNTQLRIRMDWFARKVELLRGDAIFEVAHETFRDFLVHVDSPRAHIQLLASGTEFSVRRRADQEVEALITSGHVTVTQHAKDPDGRELGEGQSVSLSAGSAAVVAADGIHVNYPTKEAMERQLSWIHGELNLNCSLQEAVNEFNRYNMLKLVVTDPELLRRNVRGVWRATDPRAFALGLWQTHHIRSEVVPPTEKSGGGEIHLHR